MKIFYESLHPEAQEELIRNGVIELVTAWVDAVPDPAAGRPACALILRGSHR